MFDLQPLRHISTLRSVVVHTAVGEGTLAAPHLNRSPQLSRRAASGQAETRLTTAPWQSGRPPRHRTFADVSSSEGGCINACQRKMAERGEFAASLSLLSTQCPSTLPRKRGPLRGSPGIHCRDRSRAGAKRIRTISRQGGHRRLGGLIYCIANFQVTSFRRSVPRSSGIPVILDPGLGGLRWVAEWRIRPVWDQI
jgi:hypothetical protein